MLDTLKNLFSSEGKEKDPICGMTVDPKTAPHEVYNGKQYYFCSENCRSEFATKPEGPTAHKNRSGCTCCH